MTALRHGRCRGDAIGIDGDSCFRKRTGSAKPNAHVDELPTTSPLALPEQGQRAERLYFSPCLFKSCVDTATNLDRMTVIGSTSHTGTMV